MRNPIRNFLKQYLYFTKRDRNAIIILIIILISGIIINEVIKHLPNKSDYNYYEFAKEFEEWEKSRTLKELKSKSLFQFNPNTITEQKLDSLLLPDFVVRNLINYRKAGGVFYKSSDMGKLYGMNDSIFQIIESYIDVPEMAKLRFEDSPKIELLPEGTFDPNLADESLLLYFGFNNYQAENLLSYIKSGGRIKTPSELLKIYGIDSIFFNEIKDFVLIKEANFIEQGNSVNEINFVVELNKADSTQLVKLNGVGPVFASRIIKYRDLLGGFNSTSQLLEVYNFPEETFQKIEKYLEVDKSEIRQIRINFAEYGDLIRHPYLDSEEVNLILKHRELNGAIQNASELSQILSSENPLNKKINPYISYR